MEDPWGSPWATSDTNTTLEPTLPRTTLELPGRTITRQRSFSTVSPWAADEDGLADWGNADSGLALPTPAATSSSIWAGWAGENAPNSSQTQLTPTLRAREGSLGVSSPSWPAAVSPGLSPSKTISRRSSARSLYRQHSPDPWSVEFSENRLSLPTPALLSTEQVAFSTLDRHQEESEEDVAKSKGDERPVQVATGVTEAADHKTAQSPDETKRGEEVDLVTATRGSAAEGGPGELTNGTPLSGSRESSVSADSHHGDRQDSPITSMDEDAKDRPRIPRRPSAKVQELVHMYNGMVKMKANALVIPPAAGVRQRSTSRGAVSIQSARTDDNSDFGDFEDSKNISSAPPSRKTLGSGSPRPASSKAGRAGSWSKESSRGTSMGKASSPEPIPEQGSDPFEDLRKNFGSLNFTLDLENIDKLFDVMRLDAEQPSAKDYSLDAVDGVITDSFTSISERKVWYRISRHGSMRKHNLGDDDSYRRVSWPGSKMREETNKIVRRWMEEDSYPGGRLGGSASAKGGGFDWDTKAEPLSMDQIFGKRKSAQPPKATAPVGPRPLSLQPALAATHIRDLSNGVQSLPPRSPGVISLPPPSPLSIPAPPESPAFGWSTMTDRSTPPVSSRPSSGAVRQSLETNLSGRGSNNSVTASTQETESRHSLQLPPPPPAPSGPMGQSMGTGALVDDEDDEEWGDMVASPPGNSRPVSGFFETGVHGSLTSLPTNDSHPAPLNTDKTLVAVTSRLQNEELLAMDKPQSPTASSAIWDFSAFDTKLTPSIAPVTTPKPGFDFGTPLQSPALSSSSRTTSPTPAFQLPKQSTPPMPTVPSRASPSGSFQLPRPPTPVVSIPSKHTPKSSIGSQQALDPPGPTSPAALQLSRPPLPALKTQHSNRPSLSMGRPSPLQQVITPKSPSFKPMSPLTRSVTANPHMKSVSFAQEDEEAATVRRIVEALPDLSYMLS